MAKNTIYAVKENIKSGGDLSHHLKQEKIIIRTTGDAIFATLDLDSHIVLNSVNILYSKNNEYKNRDVCNLISRDCIFKKNKIFK